MFGLNKPETVIPTPVEGELVPEKKPVEEIAPDLPAMMRSQLTSYVEKDFKAIVEAQAELAKGIWIEKFVIDKKTGKVKMDEHGRPNTKVYLEKPDKDAGQYLLNQVIGKPKENMVLAGKVNFIMDV